ncbi:MAG: exodeoxyribonuclease III [Pseudomonadota bacterium]
MPLTIATWNINSVRLREGLVADFLAAEEPDLLCLQETKTPVDKFPRERFTELGYPHLVVRGEKGYNGVGILSRRPIEDAGQVDFCGRGDARHVAARLEDGTLIHNLYVPAGGDEPDRNRNVKFAHKLDFVAEMASWQSEAGARAIVVGDLNIAPLEHDVWDHKKMLKIVSHTPVECEAFTAAQQAGGWRDVAREDVPEPEKLFSWWSYRAKDWALSNRGRRLDHIWSRGLASVAGSTRILKDWRGREKPSDHVPVLASFDID